VKELNGVERVCGCERSSVEVRGRGECRESE